MSCFHRHWMCSRRLTWSINQWNALNCWLKAASGISCALSCTAWCARFADKSQRYSEALKHMRRQLAAYTKLKQAHNVHRMVASITIVHLATGSVEKAEEELANQTWYVYSDVSRLSVEHYTRMCLRLTATYRNFRHQMTRTLSQN